MSNLNRFLSKWAILPEYQDAGLAIDPSNLSREQYQKLYDEGRVATYDKAADVYQPPVLPEVSISAKAPKSVTDFGKRFRKKLQEDNPSLAAQLFKLPVEAVAGLPQAAFTYLLDPEKNIVPSQALDVQNPYAAMAVDVVADPTNLVGLGVADDVLKVSGKLGKAGSKAGQVLTTKTPLKDVYKINPWAFKPNPEAAYRGIGEAGYKDLITSGEVRSLKKNAYPEPYFAKGQEPGAYAKGYMIELDPAEPMKGVGSFTNYYEDLIGTPVNKITIDNPNLRILKEHWLKGYKEVPKQQKGGTISEMGYKKSSPYKNRKSIKIDSNHITMDGVDQPLVLYPDGDSPMVVQPNSGNYFFPNSTSVTEVPLKEFKKGGLKSSQRDLVEWTNQKWRTKSGKPSHQTGERYLPEAAINALTDEEYRQTSRKKKADGGTGSVSKQPEKIADKVRPYRMKEGGSTVNQAGNYTKPGMRKRLFNQIMNSNTMGTPSGKWSARKAQLLAKKYKEQGGGYKEMGGKVKYQDGGEYKPNIQKVENIEFDSNQARKGKYDNLIVKDRKSGKDYGVIRKEDGSYDFWNPNADTAKIWDTLDPRAWGLSDRSNIDDFTKAYNLSKEQGDQNFFWKGKRYKVQDVDPSMIKAVENAKYQMLDRLESKKQAFEYVPTPLDTNYAELQVYKGQSFIPTLDSIKQSKKDIYNKYIDTKKEKIKSIQPIVTSQKGKHDMEGFWDGKTNKMYIYTPDSLTAINTARHEFEHAHQDLNDTDYLNSQRKAITNMVNNSPSFKADYSSESYDYLSSPHEIGARFANLSNYIKENNLTIDEAIEQLRNNRKIKPTADFRTRMRGFDDSDPHMDVQQLIDLYSDRGLLHQHFNEYEKPKLKKYNLGGCMECGGMVKYQDGGTSDKPIEMTLPEFTVVSSNPTSPNYETLRLLKNTEEAFNNQLYPIWTNSGKPKIKELPPERKGRAFYQPINNTMGVRMSNETLISQIPNKEDRELLEEAMSPNAKPLTDKELDQIESLYNKYATYPTPHSQDVLAELAHSLQLKVRGLGSHITKYKKDTKMVKAKDSDSPEYDKLYDIPNTIEHEAHTILEPQLERYTTGLKRYTLDIPHMTTEDYKKQYGGTVQSFLNKWL